MWAGDVTARRQSSLSVNKMASYCVTVSRLKVRRLYFAFTELLTFLLSRIKVVQSLYCGVVRPPAPPADWRCGEADKSPQWAAVIGQSVPVWLLTAASLCYSYRHTEPQTAAFNPRFIVSDWSSVSANSVVHPNDLKRPYVSKVITRLQRLWCAVCESDWCSAPNLNRGQKTQQPHI